LHQTFALAGAICLVAIVPALALGARHQHATTDQPGLRGLR
jgi:hypothetical protein